MFIVILYNRNREYLFLINYMLVKNNVSKHQGLKFEAFKNGVTLRGLRSNVILKKDRNNNKKFTIIFYKKTT